MFNLFDESKTAEVKNWPTCPNCKTRDLIILANRTSCLSCSFSGPTSALGSNELLQLAQSKLTINTKLYNNFTHFGPFPQNAGPEYGDILEERCNQLAQEALLDRYISQSEAYLAKYNKLPLVCLYYERIGETPTMLVKHSRPENMENVKESILKRAQGCEAVGIIFPTSTEKFGSFAESWEPAGKKVGFNIFMYGRPALPVGAEQVFWQPVDWSIATMNRGHIELRYLGVIEIKDDLNITISVRENMDHGGVIGSISFRDIGDMSAPRVKQLEGDTCTALIEKARANFQRIVDKTLESDPEPFLFRYQQEWDMTVEQAVIMNDICKNELWDISRRHIQNNET